MPRVKRGVQSNKRRKNILKDAKGFKWTRATKLRQAKEALLHAMSFQFADRKKKKGNFRALWQIKINAASRQEGISYSNLINKLKTANIALNRKALADIAEHHPEVFKKIIASVK